MPRVRPSLAASVVAVSLSLSVTSWVGCGSGGSAVHSPSPASTPAPNGLPVGAVVGVVSGEDQSPVPGARVILAGREYVTDGAGRIVVGDPVAFGSLVDLLAPGFLSRQTTLRADQGSRFVLWPATTRSGMSEDFTAQIVYTLGSREPPPFGSSVLRRLAPGTTLATLSLSAEIVENDHAYLAHEEAVAEVNSWLAGKVQYVLSHTRPPSGMIFDLRVDRTEECTGGVLAYFAAVRNGRGEITGGDIVYCSIWGARTVGLVTHELGHSVGLQHSYDAGGEVMNQYRTQRQDRRFSEREALAMSLLFERPAGNRFPDSDRDVAAAAERDSRIVCN